MSEADKRKDITVAEYVASLDEQTQEDAQTLVKMMRTISGQEPVLYGFGTIGFGEYHYKYDSGREGDAHTIAFYPRKGKTTVYLMDGTARYAKLLERLGKHTTTGYCVYIKQLSDIDMSVLAQIIKDSYKNITAKYQTGPIDKILWQSEE